MQRRSPLTHDAVRPFARAAARGRRLRRRQGREPRRAHVRGTAGARRLRRRRSGIRGVPRADRAARAAGASCSTPSMWRTPPHCRPRARPHERWSTRPRCPSRWRARSAAPTSSWLARIPRTPVAVRSSATAEDTAATSFAGMNETFLNIRGADAVHRRRASLLALAVRRAHDLLPRRQRLRTGRHGHRRRGAAPGQLDARRA